MFICSVNSGPKYRIRKIFLKNNIIDRNVIYWLDGLTKKNIYIRNKIQGRRK